jgi:hypothetical protein
VHHHDVVKGKNKMLWSIISFHFLGHLINCKQPKRDLILNFFYQIKTNNEIFQWDFHLYKKIKLTIYFSENKIKWNICEIIPFSYILLHLWKTSHKKKGMSWHVYLNFSNHIVTLLWGIAWILFFCVSWVPQPFFEKVVLYLIL